MTLQPDGFIITPLVCTWLSPSLFIYLFSLSTFFNSFFVYFFHYRFITFSSHPLLVSFILYSRNFLLPVHSVFSKRFHFMQLSLFNIFERALYTFHILGSFITMRKIVL